jgi:hydroxyethylthiazole kinase-like uncharacterized protein yjeF
MKKFIDIDKKEIVKIYKSIGQFTHKGIQGHAMLIGGSYGKIGAVCLSAKAALKTGCGLVTAFIPKCGYEIVQVSIPEVMVLTDDSEKMISKISFNLHLNAIGIGPGLGQDRKTQKAFHSFLKSNTVPLIIDADALNILAQHKEWFSLLPPQTILTPHPKELERLIGIWDSEQEKLNKVKALANDYDLIIVLKGAPTCIVDKEQVYINTTGNQALATAGSGDVLTGIISSLVAQSYSPLHAALLGVYLHGLTADLAVKNTSYAAFIASDIIAHLGVAFLALEDMKKESLE